VLVTPSGPLTTQPGLEAGMAADNPITRICPRCFAAFLSAKKKAGYCPPCDKQYKHEWYLRNQERLKAQAIAWRAANRERYLANNKRYYETNKPEIAKKQREYQIKNMDRHLQRSAEWRKKNLDKARDNEARYRERNRDVCNSRIREWKKSNVSKVTLYSTARRKRNRDAIPKWADMQKIRQLYRLAEHMRRASGINYQVDHIVPLISPIVCGLHCEANLRIVTQEENLKKSNTQWPDMP